MGANHVGEIAALCDIAQPDYGLITNIGKAHLEGFGGIEGVKKGKSELYKFLNAGNGTAFINGDDPTLVDLARNIKTITYGEKEHNSFRAVNTSGEGKVSFSYRSNKGEEEHVVKTQMVGTYNFINCVAAACVGTYFDVRDEDIVAALQNYLPDMNRSQLVKTKKNELILDAYNANPNSMKAAIENFVSYPAEKKMLLLGDMFELGDYSAVEHTAIVDLLKEKKMDEALLIGKEFTKAAGSVFRTFGTTQECSDYLQGIAPTGYTILIKGSRGMKMEVLQDVL
jgi:UDP-N-acetylmuramoyl-tripeptide--D-alanyl-D-alanine ligase